MKQLLLTLLTLSPLAINSAEYEKPLLLTATANDTPITVPLPGYASPFLHDLDGDGKKDLLVGQYRKGHIILYPGLGPGKFGPGKPLEADGKAVTIPGIW